jgi:hypothetical protein
MAMRELPILFSTEMVNAILNGNKSQTRRVIKPQPDKEVTQMVDWSTWLKCPYGEPGDRLFVKETWKIEGIDPVNLTMLIRYRADNECKVAQFSPERFEKFRKFYQKNGWQSPYFMPKEATRIWLGNENVRVERLWDITEEDAIKEGCDKLLMKTRSARNNFMNLWNSINTKRGYIWAMNNWVWVVEFRRVDSL